MCKAGYFCAIGAICAKPVKGMMARRTPKAQADAAMGEIKRQLIYKGLWHHCQVMLADRYYPSSKTCLACGVVNAKLKRKRHLRCGSCGTRHDRNLNAAVNLRNLLTLPPGRGTTSATGSLWRWPQAILKPARTTGEQRR